MTTASHDPQAPRVPRRSPSTYAALTFEERREQIRAEFALLDAVPPRRRPGDLRYTPSPPSTPHSPDTAAADTAAADTGQPSSIADVVALRPTTRRA